MKHQTLEQLQNIAEIEPACSQRIMLRGERLQRWAQDLERSPHRRLATLYQTEHQPACVTALMRSDNSPLTVAFEDPILRAAGLQNDTYGETKRFFELADEELHDIICYCHFGATVSASAAARHIRAAVATERPGLFARLRAIFLA
ncbi:hypothetical protein [Rhizobium sp. Root1220]|uniref:hypothetical protein n=1 Tax=Rhizobium sp. Root1220 TaxID=1736432 RepID=UPI0006F507C3|nr:hypothetical protein [Rhizobium sp. Root1220]KQV70243.1 hypothetical protein ASC90_08955 [Rhizobium sp. Root1220]